MTGGSHALIETPNELYDEIVKVTSEDQRGNWTSDLQCKVTKDTARVIERYQYRHLVTTFHFAFAPWWSDPHKYT